MSVSNKIGVERSDSQTPQDIMTDLNGGTSMLLPEAQSNGDAKTAFEPNMAATLAPVQLNHELNVSTTEANVNLEGAELKDIIQAHIDNRPENNQIESSKEFMARARFHVPLNKLYTIEASCQYQEASDFCPVLVKIRDPTILLNNNKYPYLLQVWSRMGDLLYEKPLLHPVCNWNISHNFFIFQEVKEQPIVYLVRLYLDKPCVLFKFNLPEKVVNDRINSYYDPVQRKFVVPAEKKPDVSNEDCFGNDNNNKDDGLEQSNMGDEVDELYKVDKRHEDIEEMRNLGELRSEYKPNYNSIIQDPLASAYLRKSVSEVLGDVLIERAPDKMIDVLDQFILIAFRDTIVYANVSTFGVFDEAASGSDHLVECNIEEDKLAFLDLHKNYKIVTMQEIGNHLTAIVLEDIHTRNIRFLRAFYFEGEDGTKRFKLVQLGVMPGMNTLSPSPLLKYRSIAKVDPSTGKRYQVSLVLRLNGRFEVYSDFMLVNQYINPQMQCVDIETDFNQFYLKMAVDSDKIQAGQKKEDLRYEFRQVRHFWRNRISFNTSKLKRNMKSMDIVLHKRVSGYCKLYTQILNFSTFMLVSHRNMISVYNMTKGSNTGESWVSTVDFQHGNIRQMFIKKRSKRERHILLSEKGARKSNVDNVLSAYKTFQIVTLVGSHSVFISQMNARGQIGKPEPVATQGRILRFQNDDHYNMGMLLLTDDAVASMEFQEVDKSKVYMFPLAPQAKEAEIKLCVLKQGIVYNLLSSNDSQALFHDSYFRVLRANRAVFEIQKEDFRISDESEDDEVKKAYAQKVYVPVVSVRSDIKQKAAFFALQKVRNPEDNCIVDMKLIKKEENVKEVEFDPLGEEDVPRHSFYVTSPEFGEESTDSYIAVSHNDILVYDREMDIRLKFAGLNIRTALDVHQDYLYMINDMVYKPITTEDAQSDVDTPQDIPNFTFSAPGFFVLDLKQLVLGKVSKFKLASSLGGQCSFIDNSKFSDRFSIMQDYNSVAVMPFPHLNLINCVGMGQKHEYLGWREKNGFFTALDRNSNLLTWSMLTGKLLYNEAQLHDGNAREMKKYNVYRADENDITYTQNFYNQEDRSISLLRSETPVSIDFATDKRNLNASHIERKLKKQHQINKAGLVNLDRGVKQLEGDLFKPTPDQIKVDILNSQQKADLYHFKVLQVRNHEDTQSHGEAKVLFHFMFNLLKTKKREYLQVFDWDINSNPQQRLYLSQDTSKMLEVINGFIGTVYYRENVSEDGKSIAVNKSVFYDQEDRLRGEDNGQQIKWKVDFRIKRFPKSLLDRTSVPYVFSPNFIYQIDFNYRAKHFIIKEMKTQYVYMNVPHDLINTIWNGSSGERAINMIFSRMSWLTDRILRVINESNMDCIFEMCTTDPTDQSVSARYLKLISCVTLENRHENRVSLDMPHMILDQRSLEPRDVLERLIRTNCAYKQNLLHALNMNAVQSSLLSKINRIDYLQSWTGNQSSFDIELAFTWLDWRIIELVTQDPNFDLTNVETEQQVQLCFNILPKGRGILHKLALGGQIEGKTSAEKGDQIGAFFNTKLLFEVCKENHQMYLTGDDSPEGSSLQIPILPDMYGATPLDICMGTTKQRNLERVLFKDTQDFQDVMALTENFAMAEIIFSFIKDYSFMHSSPIINESILAAIKAELPSLSDYLDSRLVQVNHAFETQTQHQISDACSRNSEAMGDYGALITKVWAPEREITSHLFDTSGALQPMSLQYLDVPFMYTNTPVGMDFIYTMAKCNDMALFGIKSVQIMIDNHNDYWKKRNFLMFGLPLTINLIFFWYWSNVVLPNYDRGDWEGHNSVCVIVLNFVAFYFLFNEIPMMLTRPRDYVTMSHMITWANAFSILWNTIKFNRDEEQFWTVQSWTALLVWVRYMLYLRTVPTFSWLVRMCIACVVDMLTFLVVLAFGVFAFADAFLSIEQSLKIRDPENYPPFVPDPQATMYQKYFQSYIKALQMSFLTAMGEFSDSMWDYDEGEWMIFFLCAIFNIILLLNLLIAIISETFANIQATSVETSYKEKCIQMAFMQDSFLGYFFKAQPEPMEQIFIAKVVNSEDISEELGVESVTNTIVERMAEMEARNQEFIESKLELLANALMQRFEGSSAASLTKKDSKLERAGTLSKRQAAQKKKPAGAKQPAAAADIETDFSNNTKSRAMRSIVATTKAKAPQKKR